MPEQLTSHVYQEEHSADELVEQFGEKPDRETVELLHSLISDEGRDRLHESIEEELEQRSDFQHFAQIESDDRRMREEDDGSDFRKTNAILDEYKRRIDLAVSLWGEESYEKYEYLKTQKHMLEKFGLVYFEADEAAGIIEGLISPSKDTSPRVPLFVDPERLRSATDSHREGSVQLQTTGSNQEVDLPVHKFISAEGMSSWYGRGVFDERTRRFSKDGQGSKKGVTSREHIENIAEIEDGIPSIEDVTAYVTKDGHVFMKSNNAHRVAAAIRKGDSSIPFKGSMRVNVLNVTSKELISSS